MNNLRWVLSFSLVLLMGCNMSGCGRGIFNTEPFVDAKKDEQGNSVLLDTSRMWNEFRETVDMQVENERLGKRPPGVPTWNEHWLRVIKHMQSGSQEHAEKYIAYIIESRRKSGLPELEGVR